MKKLHMWAIAASIIFALFGTVCTFNFLQKRKLKKEIKKHKIQYISKVGWVDWGHAIPTGPKKLIDELETSKGDTITYYQQMSKKVFGKWAVVRLTNTYYVPRSMRNSDKKIGGVARYILENTSKDFEALQNSWPYKPLCGIGIGDRNGDRIALLRALHIKYGGKLGKSKDTRKALRAFEKSDLKADKVSKTLAKLLPPIIRVKKCGASKTEHLRCENITDSSHSP